MARFEPTRLFFVAQRSTAPLLRQARAECCVIQKKVNAAVVAVLVNAVLKLTPSNKAGLSLPIPAVTQPCDPSCLRTVVHRLATTRAALLAIHTQQHSARSSCEIEAVERIQ